MELSGGDMRRAVTFLQSCYQLCGGSSINGTVTTDIVVDISGEVINLTYCYNFTIPIIYIYMYYCYNIK
jgi:hypothetical protein